MVQVVGIVDLVPKGVNDWGLGILVALALKFPACSQSLLPLMNVDKFMTSDDFKITDFRLESSSTMQMHAATPHHFV
jgi:hypothetical protein